MGAAFVRIPFPDGDVLIDKEDYDRLDGKTIYIGSNGYPYFSTNQTGPVTLHSFVMGKAPKGHEIDHRRGNKRDCRKPKLRIVTRQINQVNRIRLNKNNTSGIRGVTRLDACTRRPWHAQIMVDRKRIGLGYFETKEAAAAARVAAEIKYFGERCPS